MPHKEGEIVLKDLNTSAEDQNLFILKAILNSNNNGKKLAQTIAKTKQQYFESTAETGIEDEHRIELQPVNQII